METSAIISELSMIKAHANELAAAADNLLRKLTPKTSATRKGGLTDRQMATLIAHKNKRRVQQ